MARMYLNQRETVDVLVDVHVAVGQLRPLTVEQERHHVEKVHGGASVSGREPNRRSKKGLLEQGLGIPSKAVDDAGGRVKVGQQSQAPSRGFHMVLTVESDREVGLKELSAQPVSHVHPCWRLES